MKISDDLLHDPALRAVTEMLEQGGHRALIVGGAVRNLLMKRAAGDVDIATDADPQTVTDLARKARLKPIPTGIDHGTVTVISRGIPFEVTTFRRDVETDGRRAVVAFSDRLEDDAMRRDFTMNALYLTPQGEVLDPVGGLPDLHSRTLRFVGDAEARIAEDYLRILRFFRFLAWYGEHTAPGTLQAIRAGRAGLSRVSAERIGAELRKLLSAPDPAPALLLMQDSGVLDLILPGADAAPLPALIAAETEHRAPPDWPRRLAALRPGEVADRLRLSRAEAKSVALLTGAGTQTLEEIAFRHGAAPARDIALIRSAQGQPPAPGWAERIAHAANAPLPIAARDLTPELSGPALGRGLSAAERMWIDSGFAAPRPALIDAALLAGQEDG